MVTRAGGKETGLLAPRDSNPVSLSPACMKQSVEYSIFMVNLSWKIEKRSNAYAADCYL